MTSTNKKTGLVPMITAAGLAAAMRADLGGVKLSVRTIGLGDGFYAPKPDQTKLKQEKQRIPVGGATKASPTQVHLTAIEDGDKAYWIREIGFFLEDGTLFAVWSDPEKPLAYKAPGVDLLLAFDLVLEALPNDLIEVTVNSDLSLLFASEFANVATAIVGLQRRELETERRLKALDKSLSELGVQHKSLTEDLKGQKDGQAAARERLADQVNLLDRRLDQSEERQAGTLRWLVQLTRLGLGNGRDLVGKR